MRYLYSIVALAISFACSAAEEEFWTGKIGTKDIYACLKEKDGSYYYGDFLTKIPMKRMSENEWIEYIPEGPGSSRKSKDLTYEPSIDGYITGKWRTEKESKDRIKGVFYSPNGAESHINIRRADYKCGSDFYERIFSSKVKVGSGKNSDNKYRIKSEDGEINFSLYEEKQDQSINKAITASVANEISRYYECNLYYKSHISVSNISTNFIVIRIANDNYCGGAHPSDDIDYINYDVVSEKHLMNDDIFIKGEITYAASSERASDLERLVCRRLISKGGVCEDVLDARLSRDGVTFSPHVGYYSGHCRDESWKNCKINVLIRYPEIRKYLSKRLQRTLFH